MPILDLSFYRRKTKIVAQDLLGKKLVRICRGHRISGIITEVEAYLGVQDKACHTYNNRRTPRTEPMYLEGGHAYIYSIYGMYNCFNVVTEEKEIPEAILIRALEPSEGISWMQKFRNRTELKDLTTGPGKLAQALHITKEFNSTALDSKTLFLETVSEKNSMTTNLKKSQIVKKPRVGVDYAGDHALWPLRFYIRNSPYISKK